MSSDPSDGKKAASTKVFLAPETFVLSSEMLIRVENSWWTILWSHCQWLGFSHNLAPSCLGGQVKPEVTVADRREHMCWSWSVRSCWDLSARFESDLVSYGAAFAHSTESIPFINTLAELTIESLWVLLPKAGLAFQSDSLFFDCPLFFSMHIHHFRIFLCVTYWTSSNYW